MIWKNPLTLELLHSYFQKSTDKTMLSHLGIQFVQVGDSFIEASLPVDERTRQPAGLLHGGASAVLAETLGSVASIFVVGMEAIKAGKSCVGIELNASHLNAMRSGSAMGRVTPIRLGRSLHVWEIKIWDSANSSRLICISRLTVLVKDSA